jgi:uncharacterized membrane protein YphA (DoxX/SURF4 family)
VFLRRLFSTFARGWPGAGLLGLRVVAGIAAIAAGLQGRHAELATGLAILHLLGAAGGLLILIGLWTPLSGWVVAAFALWNAVSPSGDPWANILLAAIGAALALVGPGAWSIDARLFGWKRIDIRERPR